MTADKVTEYYHLAFQIIDKTQQKSVFYKNQTLLLNIHDPGVRHQTLHPHNPELDKKIDVWMDVYIYLHS